MSFFNKFMNFIGLPEDNEPSGNKQTKKTAARQDDRIREEADDFESEFGAYEEQQIRRKSRRINLAEDGDDTMWAEEEQEPKKKTAARPSGASVHRTVPRQHTAGSEPDYERETASPRYTTARVHTVHTVHSTTQAKKPSHVILKPRTVEDCRDAIQALIAGNTVLLNTSLMDAATERRAVDIMSGAMYALKAEHTDVSEHVYLFEPA